MKIRNLLTTLLLAAGIVLVAGCDGRSYRHGRSSPTRSGKPAVKPVKKLSTGKSDPNKAGSKIKKKQDKQKKQQPSSKIKGQRQKRQR